MELLQIKYIFLKIKGKRHIFHVDLQKYHSCIVSAFIWYLTEIKMNF